MKPHLVNWNALERPALLTDKGLVFTYDNLRSEVQSLSKKLIDRSLVFLLVSNDKTSIVSYLACLESGAVPLLLDAQISIESINKLIKNYKPNFIIAPKERLEIFETFKVVEFWDDYVLLSNKHSKYLNINSKLALLLTTSGSTGSSKLVRLSLKNIISNAQSIVKYLEINKNERAISTLPFNYSYGMSVINSHMLAGASVVLTNKSFFDSLFWKLVKEYDVTSIAGVPYSYEILKKLRFENMSLPSLRIMTQAGGKLSLELTKYFLNICKSKNIKFYTMYGQTEASPRMAYLKPDQMRLKIGSIGKAIADGRLWIEGDKDSIVSKNPQVGELVYSGPNVALGYAEKLNDLQNGDEWRGVLYTGDIARKDDEGYFYIEGRMKRFIKIFGVRLSLDSIEMWLLERGLTSAALGNDDHLCLFFESDNSSVLEKTVNDLCLDMKIHPSAVSTATCFVLPRLKSGKVDYKSLLEIC